MASWNERNKIKCVVLCAGKGTRIIPHSLTLPKSMINVSDKPILDWIINYWKNYTKDFIFVVGYKKEQIMDYVKKLDINCEFVEQEEQIGLADALNKARDLVTENFIVVLGDCMIKGELEIDGNMENGVAVWGNCTDYSIRENFSVEHNGSLITKMVEKPKEFPKTAKCGTGIYFFNKKIFGYMDKIKTQNLTLIMQKMVEDGERFTPIIFNGHYTNVNYPHDIEEAEKLFE